MGDLEGVGRIYRPEMNPQSERHPQVDRAERDKQGKGQHDRQEDQPHDTVELHEEPDKGPKGGAQQASPKDRKLDISA